MSLTGRALSLRPALGAALLACCCGCVPPPAGFVAPEAGGRALEAPVRGLDPGHKTEETAHFRVSAYSSAAASEYAALAERNYSRIMQDLGIFSFVPARPYNVTVYRDRDEYRAKTGQPEWSGGAAYGNALLLYEGPRLGATMAHEMTHLVFNEFMGLSQSPSLRWLNEGVAVYEESRSSQESEAFFSGKVFSEVAPNPIPFSLMTELAPQGESLKDVDRWYAQAGSVAGFMIRTGGAFSFSMFLSRLKDGAGVDAAIASAYPGGWKNLSEVEQAWLLHVRR